MEGVPEKVGGRSGSGANMLLRGCLLNMRVDPVTNESNTRNNCFTSFPLRFVRAHVTTFSRSWVVGVVEEVVVSSSAPSLCHRDAGADQSHSPGSQKGYAVGCDRPFGIIAKDCPDPSVAGLSTSAAVWAD